MKTIAEIEAAFDLSFHDALMLGIVVDYRQREARVEFNVYDGEGPSGEEVYRRGALVFRGVASFSIEPPEKYPTAENCKDGLLSEAGNWADEKEEQSNADALSRAMPASLPGYVHTSVFVEQWNGFVRVRSEGVDFQWLEPAWDDS